MASNKNRSAALSSIKMQAANEVGVPLKDKGYNGDLTAKQAGSVGGQMVKKMIPVGIMEYIRPMPFGNDGCRVVQYRLFIDL